MQVACKNVERGLCSEPEATSARATGLDSYGQGSRGHHAQLPEDTSQAYNHSVMYEEDPAPEASSSHG